MKKAYSKPEIMFEDFTLNVNIASCSVEADGPTKGSCAIVGTGGIGVFSDSIAGCEYSPEDLGGDVDIYDDACYYVPTADNSLFGS